MHHSGSGNSVTIPKNFVREPFGVLGPFYLSQGTEKLRAGKALLFLKIYVCLFVTVLTCCEVRYQSIDVLETNISVTRSGKLVIFFL